MSDSSIENVWIVAVAAIIGLLILVGVRAIRPTRRGLAPIFTGLGLILLGGLLGIADDQGVLQPIPVISDPAFLKFLREIVCFVGGFTLLVMGFIGWLAAASVAERIQQLNDALVRMGLQLKADQELLNSVVTSSISGVMILKVLRAEGGTITDFECQLMNREAEQLLGLSAGALVGQPLLQELPCISDSGLFQDAVSVVETRLPFRDERYCLHVGTSKWYQIVAVKHGDGIVVSFADVTNRRRHEEQLQHAAQHDPLTGLSNRALFSERLTQAIGRAQHDAESKFAVLFVDLDRFKSINDNFGHEVGDRLLLSVSERLRDNLRGVDTTSRVEGEHLPARLGGDEFAVLLDHVSGVRDVMQITQRIEKALSAPHKIAGHEVVATASIGIVTSDSGYDQPDDVIRAADAAMYRAKKSDDDRIVLFDEDMHREAVMRRTLEAELRHAVEHEQFTLVFQPIVSLHAAALTGFEALIRWPHPQRGTLAADAFIGLAEELGLIVKIDTWVLRHACRQLLRWRRDNPGRPALSMGVNLSRQQLTDPAFVSTVAELIEETGIDDGSLHFEINESSILQEADQLASTFASLREIGVRLAMDDFGTGHASLSFLHRVPMDILKIDRTFINTAANPTADRGVVVQTVVQFAHNLKMQVVAEGIETQDQLMLLRALDCNYGQGFLFSKPLEAEAAGGLLNPEYRFTMAA